MPFQLGGSGGCCCSPPCDYQIGVSLLVGCATAGTYTAHIRYDGPGGIVSEKDITISGGLGSDVYHNPPAGSWTVNLSSPDSCLAFSAPCIGGSAPPWTFTVAECKNTNLVACVGTDAPATLAYSDDYGSCTLTRMTCLAAGKGYPTHWTTSGTGLALTCKGSCRCCADYFQCPKVPHCYVGTYTYNSSDSAATVDCGYGDLKFIRGQTRTIAVYIMVTLQLEPGQWRVITERAVNAVGALADCSATAAGPWWWVPYPEGTTLCKVFVSDSVVTTCGTLAASGTFPTPSGPPVGCGSGFGYSWSPEFSPSYTVSP